jgi:4-hydroxythreonine-4-phosphate dehydrogenase
MLPVSLDRINPAAPFAVTMGDPAGIGPEIIVKGWTAKDIAEIRKVVIGDFDLIASTARRYNSGLLVQPVASPEEVPDDPQILSVLIPPGTSGIDAITPGQPSVASGRWAYACVKMAVDLARERRIAAMTTAPLTKVALRAAGYNYPGHTELIADLCGSPRVGMMLVGGPLRVILVTIHIALREVAGQLTRERELDTIRLAAEALRLLGVSETKIAVAALNPHAGESSLFGDEEERIIFPAVMEARSEGLDVEGPVPADTLFHRTSRGDFAIVVAQYHDQGLIPLKLMGFGKAVNVTIGLPILRTSVDHGTAYNIVGKGLAQPGSLVEAVRLAHSIVLRHAPR